MKPELSVIIVSFNTKEVTLACLTSLYQHTTDLDFEVVIVDNGSTDGTVDELTKFTKSHNNATLIPSSINLGFGNANNLGAKNAAGQYFLFLNSDTVLTANILPKCLARARASKVGVYSCGLVNIDGTPQVSGGRFPNLGRLIAWQFFIDDLPLIGRKIGSIHPRFSSPIVDWVTGAFMLIPAAVFKKIGGFDENIFMYTEEVELCYRIKKLGHPVVLDQSTIITHLGGASGGTYLALTKEVEGWLYFWQKYLPSRQLALVKLIFFSGSLLRLIIFGIIKADVTARKSYLQILRLVA